MTKDFLEERLAATRQALKQVEANGNALVGAIQAYEYLLANFDTPDEPARSPVANGADSEAPA